MSVRVTSVTTFTGTNTTTDERELLKKVGYVHVTGLSVVGDSNNIIGQQLRDDELGGYDSNNCISVIVTKGGEIWLRTMTPNHPDFENIIEALGLEKKSLFVPLSNGEQLNTVSLLRRVAYPDSGLVYQS